MDIEEFKRLAFESNFPTQEEFLQAAWRYQHGVADAHDLLILSEGIKQAEEIASKG